MDEQLPIGSSVAEIQADDLDVDAKLTFEIIGGTYGHFFYIDSIYPTRSGVLKIAQVGIEI